MHPSNGACINKPSEETTWTKPLASESSCANYTEYQKATIKEESDTEEWVDSSDETSVNGPSLTIWMTSMILSYSILVQTQVSWNYPQNYQSMPH